MKKTFALLIVLLLVFASLLCACSPKDEAPPDPPESETLPDAASLYSAARDKLLTTDDIAVDCKTKIHTVSSSFSLDETNTRTVRITGFTSDAPTFLQKKTSVSTAGNTELMLYTDGHHSYTTATTGSETEITYCGEVQKWQKPTAEDTLLYPLSAKLLEQMTVKKEEDGTTSLSFSCEDESAHGLFPGFSEILSSEIHPTFTTYKLQGAHLRLVLNEDGYIVRMEGRLDMKMSITQNVKNTVSIEFDVTYPNPGSSFDNPPPEGFEEAIGRYQRAVEDGFLVTTSTKMDYSFPDYKE